MRTDVLPSGTRSVGSNRLEAGGSFVAGMRRTIVDAGYPDRTMSKDPKLELLAGVPLFEQLGKRELQRVGALADVVDLPAGRTLMREGETGTEAMVIVEGIVSVEQGGTVIAERGPGEVIGEMALISHQPRSATVCLKTDAQLLVIGRREFEALMRELPSVYSQVMECLALRLIASESGSGH
jgi:CRP/FNR family cyclic AMP-dependent transcriptional regulator